MGGSRPCSDPCRSELKGLEGVDRHERPLGMHSEQDTKGLAICQAAERLRSRLNSGELHNMLLPFSPKPLACMCARTTFVRVTYVDERRVDTPRTHKVSEQHPFSPNGRTATRYNGAKKPLETIRGSLLVSHISKRWCQLAFLGPTYAALDSLEFGFRSFSTFQSVIIDVQCRLRWSPSIFLSIVSSVRRPNPGRG